MQSSREQALATLGLAATPDPDSATVQRAFERLARRYPQPSFPDRFRQLLEARDALMDPGRSWRGMLEGNNLDLSWMLRHLSSRSTGKPTDRRSFLQSLLRAGYNAETLSMEVPDDFDEDEDDDDDDLDDVSF